MCVCVCVCVCACVRARACVSVCVWCSVSRYVCACSREKFQRQLAIIPPPPHSSERIYATAPLLCYSWYGTALLYTKLLTAKDPHRDDLWGFMYVFLHSKPAISSLFLLVHEIFCHGIAWHPMLSPILEGADDGPGAKNVNLLFCERAYVASEQNFLTFCTTKT